MGETTSPIPGLQTPEPVPKHFLLPYQKVNYGLNGLALPKNGDRILTNTMATPQKPRSYRVLAQFGLVVADVIISLGAFVLAFVLTHKTFGWEDIHWWSGFVFEHAPESRTLLRWEGMPLPMWIDFYPYFTGVLMYVPLVRVLTLYRLGGYQLEGDLSIAQDLLESFRAVTIGTILLIVFAFSLNTGTGETRFVAGRRIFLADWGLALAGITAIRILMRVIQRHARRHGRNITPIILVGKGPQADMIREEIESDPLLGYRVAYELPVIGDESDIRSRLGNLSELIRQYRAREVFIASQQIRHVDLLHVLAHTPEQVSFKAVPNLLGLRPKKVDISRMRNIPLLEIFVDPIRGATGKVKRGMDLLIAGCAILALSVPMMIIAALIKLDSKGPVFFKQTRMGRDFRPFKMYKFRSMRTDVDSARHEAFMKRVIQEGGGEIDEKTGQAIFKEKDDPRITRLGHFIRKYSIDELPQLFNVIAGEMSIVGPRPPVPYEVAMYADRHMLRMSATPGITGLWQVSGRNAVSFERMVQMDITYMENWSIWTDIKIIFQTVPVVLFPKDTY